MGFLALMRSTCRSIVPTTHRSVGSRLVVVALCAAACGSPAVGTNTPAVATEVSRLVKALRADDAKRAYAMLDADVKKRWSFDDFAELWQTSSPERKTQARQLEEGIKSDPDLGERAAIRFGDGKTVYLRREKGAWKLESALVSRVHAGTAYDAVTIMSEALVQKDFGQLLQILSSRRQKTIGRQVDRFTKSLEALLKKNASVSHLGRKRAELHWDDGGTRYKIVIIREGDEWRIDDVHSRVTPKDATAKDPPKPATGAPKDKQVP